MQREQVQAFVHNACAAANLVRGLVICTGFDASPMQVTFGRFADQMLTHARYFIKEDSGRWRAVDRATYQAHNRTRSMPKKGTLEIYAQCMSVHYGLAMADCDLTGWHSHEILAPPVFLSKANSSCFAQAQEDLPLSLKELKTLAANRSFVVLSEAPDAAASNLRFLAYVDAELPANVFHHVAPCAVHLVHRVASNAITEKSVVGDVYSLQFVIKQPSLHVRMLQAWRAIVVEDLNIIPVLPDWQPDPAHRKHTMNIINHALGRRLGRCTDDQLFFDEGEERRYQEASEKLLHFFNGDVTGRLTHFCKGYKICCDSVDDCFDNCYTAAIEGGLFMSLVSQLPSKSRFGSFGISAAAQSAGVFIHGILKATVEKAFPDWESGEPEAIDNDDVDFRRMVQKKVWRSRKFLAEGSRLAKTVLAAWTSEPMDTLWLRLEAMDDRGSALRDAATSERSPFRQCIIELRKSLTTPVTQTYLAPLIHHWGEDSEARAFLLPNARAQLASMLVQLEYFCICLYEDWPYLFAKIASLDDADPTRLDWMRQFYNTPVCCLAASFSRKVDNFTSVLLLLLVLILLFVLLLLLRVRFLFQLLLLLLSSKSR